MNDSIRIGYYGNSVFKIQSAAGKTILIDPFITGNGLCKQPLNHFYDADYVLLSHAASDHFGDTIDILQHTKAILACGWEVVQYCTKNGVPRERMVLIGYGHDDDLGGIHLKTVFAVHASRIGSGADLLYGDPFGFIVTLENGVRIFHAGDTALFGDLKEIGMLYRPNIFMLGVDGWRKGKASALTIREAALATLWVGPDVVVPMHYPDGSTRPEEFRQAVRLLAPNVRPVIMKPGMRMTYVQTAINLEEG